MSFGFKGDPMLGTISSPCRNVHDDFELGIDDQLDGSSSIVAVVSSSHPHVVGSIHPTREVVVNPGKKSQRLCCKKGSRSKFPTTKVYLQPIIVPKSKQKYELNF